MLAVFCSGSSAIVYYFVVRAFSLLLCVSRAAFRWMLSRPCPLRFSSCVYLHRRVDGPAWAATAITSYFYIYECVAAKFKKSRTVLFSRAHPNHLRGRETTRETDTSVGTIGQLGRVLRHSMLGGKRESCNTSMPVVARHRFVLRVNAVLRPPDDAWSIGGPAAKQRMQQVQDTHPPTESCCGHRTVPERPSYNIA